MGVIMSMLVFWVVTPCVLIGRCQPFGERHIFVLEDEDSVFSETYIGMYLRVHTALQPKTPTSTT